MTVQLRMPLLDAIDHFVTAGRQPPDLLAQLDAWYQTETDGHTCDPVTNADDSRAPIAVTSVRSSRLDGRPVSSSAGEPPLSVAIVRLLSPVRCPMQQNCES